MVRNELFRWVELLARRAYGELAERLATREWTAESLAEAMAAYWADHDAVGIGPDARGPGLFQVRESAGEWTVRQVLDDPDGERDRAVHARVDLAASDEAGHAVVELVSIDPASTGPASTGPDPA
jgi:hypothetical protein